MIDKYDVAKRLSVAYWALDKLAEWIEFDASVPEYKENLRKIVSDAREEIGHGYID